MSNDGIVQVPPDSTGAKIDGASIGVAGNTVIRQRIVIGDNSASAKFADITNGALMVSPLAVAISGTASVVVGAGTANMGAVSLAAGTSNIGFINNISATVVAVISNFVDSSGNNRNVVDSVNTALRVNIVAGAAAGVSQIDDTSFSTGAATFAPIGAVFSDAGTGQSLSASHAGALRMTGFRALHTNLRNSAGTEVGTPTSPLSVKVENVSATQSFVLAGIRDLLGATVSIVDATTAAFRVIGAGTGNSLNIGSFIDSSGNTRNLVDSVNLALRVNVVAGSGSGANPVSIAAGTSNIGFINNISATIAAVIAAGAANIGFIDHISATVNIVGAVQLAAGAAQIGLVSGSNVNVSNTPSVILAAGTANFGFINNISATVNVAIATPFTINNISRTVECTISTPFTINAISATVTVTTANPYIINVHSSTHGPRMVQISTSATATLIAAPGAGFHTYVTQINVSNAGTVMTAAQLGWSGSVGLVTMVAAANGGGFVINFDPPWKVQSNEIVTCRVKPNSLGNVYFNINYYVST